MIESVKIEAEADKHIAEVNSIFAKVRIKMFFFMILTFLFSFLKLRSVFLFIGELGNVRLQI